MKKIQRLLAAALAFACSTSVFAGTYKTITIDGDISDWVGVTPAYTDEDGDNNPGGVDFENVYLANDANYLYIRFTLKHPADPVSAGNTYIWLDNDNNAATGFHPFGNSLFGSSLMIIGDQAYQEGGGGFNEGSLTNASVAYGATALPGTNFEFKISRHVNGVANAFAGVPLLDNTTIEVQLASETGGGDSLPSFPNYGNLSYTFATPPAVLTTNLPLIRLAATSWQVNQSGTDLGIGWLDPAYDDTLSPWTSGNGLFGYTPAPGVYPAINTALTSSGQNTYYFRTHFSWNNLPDNVAFVVTNYLSDGAVYYVNGVEVNRVRMPVGAVTYATSAASTNSPAGHKDVFSIPPGVLVLGDNLFEVEAHQEASSSVDMVFGLSLTAAAQYPILNLDTNLPADQLVVAGNPTTFSANLIGSGPLAYQWLKNSNPITGATNASYTIPTVINTDAGSYALQVINPISTNTTRAAVLTVSNIPVSFSDASLPADVIAVEGQAVTLSSSVAGSPPFQYQWYQANTAITAATNSTYTIPFLMPSNSGSYHVAVSNPANATNSRTASLTVLLDPVAPVLTHISATRTQIAIDFSKPVDPLTATNTSHYSVSGGVSITGAAMNPANANEVILNTGTTLNFGIVYTVTISGVKDLFNNIVSTSCAFARNITIDGSFADWDGMTPAYSGPSGSDGAADFATISVFNDASKYYFHVTLWHDIPPDKGEFPAYVNMFFDTDNNINTGYLSGSIGSELLIQSGFSYQEKNGSFNDNAPINGINWTCLPAVPGTNFEFSVSRAAIFSSDNTLVFPTNAINFVFQGMDTGFNALNLAPASGVISYTNASVNVASLPLGRLAITSLSSGNVAVVWNSPGILQERGSLTSGAWTNLPAATNPYVVPGSGSQHYFRLTQ